MKSLRKFALTLALSTLSICSVGLYAQQEVDPDHFDQPSVHATHARGLKTQRPHDTKAQQRSSEKKLAGASVRNTHRGQSVHHSTTGQDAAGK